MPPPLHLPQLSPILHNPSGLGQASRLQLFVLHILIRWKLVKMNPSALKDWEKMRLNVEEERKRPGWLASGMVRQGIPACTVEEPTTAAHPSSQGPPAPGEACKWSPDLLVAKASGHLGPSLWWDRLLQSWLPWTHRP